MGGGGRCILATVCRLAVTLSISVETSCAMCRSAGVVAAKSRRAIQRLCMVFVRVSWADGPGTVSLYGNHATVSVTRVVLVDVDQTRYAR